MASPLESTIRKSIYNGMKGIFLDATLTRDVAGNGAAYDPGSPTPSSYACKAIRETFGVGRTPPLVNGGTVKVTILQLSLAVTPQPGDRITITGQGGPYSIVPEGADGPAVSADPANAIWECSAKD